MTVEEYRKLGIKKLSFPSGLEVSITLPSAQVVLGIFSEGLSNTEMVKRMLDASEFSDGLMVSDIKDLEDYTYLATTISGFFVKTAPSSTGDSVQEQTNPEPCVVSLSEDSKNTD